MALTKSLRCLVSPSSVAVIGASEKSGTVGEVLTRNLVNGGFEGEILPVNPSYQAVAGMKCYAEVAALPKAPDLAVIATPADTVPGIITRLGRKGTRAAVVLTAGFGEGGSAKGRTLCKEMLDAARSCQLRIVGPNCLGVMVPGVGLNASMAHIARPKPGSIAFVGQSGAVQTAVLDWAEYRGIGFSYIVSLGNMADVDFADMFDLFSNDIRTRAILVHMETIRNARSFMSAARALSRMKPVIVLKAGRSRQGSAAAMRHTGAAAGDDAVYDAAFRRAGMLRVHEVQELFDALETLTVMPRQFTGDRLAIVTNSGGMGVIAADALSRWEGCLAELSAETMGRLDAVLPPTWSRGNPVDILNDSSIQHYSGALEAVLSDEGVNAVLVLSAPSAVLSPTDAAVAVVDTYKERAKRHRVPTLLTSWLGERDASEARKLFAEHGIPDYQTPNDAVRAFMHMVHYRRNQESLMETPPSIPESFSPDLATALETVRRATAADRRWLSDAEVRTVLSAYGIQVVPSLAAETPERAAAIAAEVGGAVALQLISPESGSKAGDACGIVLHLDTPDAVRKTAQAMAEYMDKTSPETQPLGFMVKPMAPRSCAHELMIGVVNDEQFGPVVSFGHGGKDADAIHDRALALPPLNMHLARELMSCTRIHQALRGRDGAPPADLESIALVLVKVSQLVCDLGEVVELEINPLLADALGVVALDARLRVAGSELKGPRRLAIRPYPTEMEEFITFPDGKTLQIRPIKPEDEPGFVKVFDSLTPLQKRMRFLQPMPKLPHTLAARLTQIDYDREMALVLAENAHRPFGEQDLHGIVSLFTEPDGERAEYAIVVRSDVSGKGLGRLLMRRIIDYARKRGIREIFGLVSSDNAPMLRVCKLLGFASEVDSDDPGVVTVSLRL